jgi:hypothetical protein
MGPFYISPIGAAVIFAILAMGILGMFVLLPIACIQITWNSFITQIPVLPPINAWQATLLYLAGATLLYLSGIVQIEIETERID